MATKETRISKFKRLMYKQENIRNICTSAHIHHGKCISGNSRLLFTDGSIKTAKEIFDEVSKDGKIYRENAEYTIFTPNKKIEIFSLNKNTEKIEKKEIQYVWRLMGGKTIKIKLKNGFEIETTPEHKYIVMKDGNFVEIEAKDLKLGDKIVCAKRLEINFILNLKKEILIKLANENFYVNLKENFSNFLKKKIIKYGIKKIKKEIAVLIKAKFFYYDVWHNRYSLNDLIKIAEFFNLKLENIYDQIAFIFYRTKKQRKRNFLKMKLPKNFKEFFYLAGLFLGNGFGKKFIVKKEKLKDKFIEICNNLGINPKIRKRKDRTLEIHTNLTLVYILKNLFNYPLKEKSYNINISDFVFNSSKNLVAHLLRGYFDCNGSVEKSRSAVTISSTNKKNDERFTSFTFEIWLRCYKKKE